MTDLLTDITFAVSPDTPGAVEFDFARVVSEGRPLYKASRPCLIRDLRPRLATDAPGLDQEGFEVCEVPYDELDAGDGWEDKYAKAMCDWLCRHLGAREVVYQNFHVRRRIADDDPLHPKGFDETKLQPAQFAHVDNSQATSFAKACATLGLTADAGKSERLAMINLWRPLKGPVVDSPLCFVDAQTIKDEDLELAADHYGVGSYAKYSPAHKWWYLRDMMPDELLIFRCFESGRSPDQGGVTIHTAVTDEARSGKGFPLRQSVEQQYPSQADDAW